MIRPAGIGSIHATHSLPCLVLVGLVGSCGDEAAKSDPEPEPPDSWFFCGEVDVDEPVEPIWMGADADGCPIVRPVPCTRRTFDDDWPCGADCSPAIAHRSDGVPWVVGCALESRLPDGCADPEPDPPPLCLVDPYEGEQWWFWVDCAFANTHFIVEHRWPVCTAFMEDASHQPNEAQQ